MSIGNYLRLKSRRGLFYLHLLAIAVLLIFLVSRGFLTGGRDQRFHRRRWYPPLLTSVVWGGATASAWQLLTRRNPSRAMRAVFWLGPVLTFAVSFLLISIGSPGSLATGVLALVFAVIQSLYGCWVNQRVDYSTRILSNSLAPVPPNTGYVILSVIIGAVYAIFLVAGVGEATANGAAGVDAVFIAAILLSLAWTMHVVRNVPHVAMARVAFMKLMSGIDVDTRVALRATVKHSLGSVCIGSVLAPVLGAVRHSARAARLLEGGDTGEFMFSCGHCISGIASGIVKYGNRWGFVLVGACNMGFVQSSRVTWNMFRGARMIPVIDYDLTGSFCFLSGVAVGAICTLVAGSWTLVVHKSYATEVSIYAFIIGYLICRIAMAWPQACVAAYYVTYAEGPQSEEFDSITIQECIHRIERRLA